MKYNLTMFFKNGSQIEHEILGFEFSPLELKFSYLISGQSQDLITNEIGKTVSRNAFTANTRDIYFVVILRENGVSAFCQEFDDSGLPHALSEKALTMASYLSGLTLLNIRISRCIGCKFQNESKETSKVCINCKRNELHSKDEVVDLKDNFEIK